MRKVQRVLPPREVVFIESLLYHGFRCTHFGAYIKKRKGYVIPATERDNASGVDFFIKMPGETAFREVQLTQHGVGMYRKYHEKLRGKLEDFKVATERRISEKRRWCRQHGILFVLVRDFEGLKTNPRLAMKDVRALRYAVARAR